jgi:hypothetical protein
MSHCYRANTSIYSCHENFVRLPTYSEYIKIIFTIQWPWPCFVCKLTKSRIATRFHEKTVKKPLGPGTFSLLNSYTERIIFSPRNLSQW